MRASPLARHGLSDVPTPLEPLGQSSRSLAGGGSTLGAGGGATAAAALGFAAAGFFSTSSSQPARSTTNVRPSTSFDEFMAREAIMRLLAKCSCRGADARLRACALHLSSLNLRRARPTVRVIQQA